MWLPLGPKPLASNPAVVAFVVVALQFRIRRRRRKWRRDTPWWSWSPRGSLTHGWVARKKWLSPSPLPLSVLKRRPKHHLTIARLLCVSFWVFEFLITTSSLFFRWWSHFYWSHRGVHPGEIDTPLRYFRHLCGYVGAVAEVTNLSAVKCAIMATAIILPTVSDLLARPILWQLMHRDGASCHNPSCSACGAIMAPNLSNVG